MKKWSITLVLLALVIIGIAIPAGAKDETNAYTPVPKSQNTQAAYISDLYGKDGKLYAVKDEIEWLEGEDANRLFREEYPDAGFDTAPDGYMIVNKEEKQEAVQVSPNAEVLMQAYSKTGDPADLDIQWNEPVTLDTFQSLLESPQGELLKEYPYHLTIEDGIVTKIVQQYIP
ncbi:hypothetical protein J31TS4_09760 [Paenibacillus sp. J31TS4]|uniref:hypothetical protein n=1 Tax=Paenibacillus sp. J31TS4 TaxID=2807195 RepID=UPI001B2437E3|nr:hypothetical protein [Paenibacillus sp. J31TS4]GIP37696.1 hypothetical protein J31TS4_09760 [Paenibacillus sp. J31TS4]